METSYVSRPGFGAEGLERQRPTRAQRANPALWWQVMSAASSGAGRVR